LFADKEADVRQPACKGQVQVLYWDRTEHAFC
jgi:hypothetical protein